MPSQYYGQRQHIVHSLDALLHQLLAVSYFLSPSLSNYLTRFAIQHRCVRPRDFEPNTSLAFHFGTILLFNSWAFYHHAFGGATEGRTIILDFVGMSFTPSKLHLITMDITIILLQILITTISYECSLSSTTDIPDILLDMPESEAKHSPYVIDLRLKPLMTRIRSPPAPTQNAANGLPLPNTSPLRALWNARLEQRSRRLNSSSTAQERIPGDINTPEIS